MPNFNEDVWDTETKKLVAFLYGVAIHYTADEIWEGLTKDLERISYGFIRALAIMNENSTGTVERVNPTSFAADFYM